MFSLLRISLIASLVAVSSAWAASSGVALDKAPINLRDTASLQRGAKYFVNYCQGCHSAEYMRYKRVAQDLGIVDAEGEIAVSVMEQNLIPAKGATINSAMLSSMSKTDAADWFGAPPPDLTLVSRVRGQDWLYSYLRTFYKDDSRPWGVNNLVFPGVGMPHVLLIEQGVMALKAGAQNAVEGQSLLSQLEMVEPGQKTPEEFDQMVADIVNFLVYMGEPMKLKRQFIGVWTLLFLSIFFMFAWMLKREYWKDVKK